jgi:hypothetical protein
MGVGTDKRECDGQSPVSEPTVEPAGGWYEQIQQRMEDALVEMIYAWCVDANLVSCNQNAAMIASACRALLQEARKPPPEFVEQLMGMSMDEIIRRRQRSGGE